MALGTPVVAKSGSIGTAQVAHCYVRELMKEIPRLKDEIEATKRADGEAHKFMKRRAELAELESEYSVRANSLKEQEVPLIEANNTVRQALDVTIDQIKMSSTDLKHDARMQEHKALTEEVQRKTVTLGILKGQDAEGRMEINKLRSSVVSLKQQQDRGSRGLEDVQVALKEAELQRDSARRDLKKLKPEARDIATFGCTKGSSSK
jgi:chromosome segregation ATPase